MAAGLPTLVVEVAFTSDSLDTTPTWVDITSYVRAGSIRSGRTNELDEFQTGSCSLTLDNRDRRFDPLYSAGPYYGASTPPAPAEYLKARKQCRIRATYSAVTYDLFYGFVSGWALSPDISGDSVCQIEGYDGLGYLAGVDLPVDFYTWTVQNLGNQPIAWWLLGASDSLAVDKIGTYNWTYTTATPSTGDAPSKWMGGSSTTFDGSYGVIGAAVATVAAAWSVTGFFNTDTLGPTGYVNPIIANAGPDNATIGIDDSGRLVFRNSSAGAVNSGFSGADGKWHHFAITYPGGGASPKCYVDGFDLSFGQSGSGDNGSGWQLISGSNHVGDATAFTGSLAHIACYDVELIADEIAILALAGLSGKKYAGVLTIDGMVDQVTIAAGWPIPWTTLESGTVKTGGIKWGQNALTVLQQLALTEGGRVFVDQAGELQFYNRSHDFTATRSTTSQATYSDSGLAAVVPFNSVGEISYTDAYLANSVTVTTAEGLAFTSTDATSITAYGTVAKQIDTLLDSQADAQTYADIYLYAYKDPSLRIQEWKVAPQAKGLTAFPKVLDARLADRVTFEILPNSLGSRISEQLIVEQIAHDFTPDTWTTTFSGSPAPLAWLLEDATYGLLESTTILG